MSADSGDTRQAHTRPAEPSDSRVPSHVVPRPRRGPSEANQPNHLLPQARSADGRAAARWRPGATAQMEDEGHDIADGVAIEIGEMLERLK